MCKFFKRSEFSCPCCQENNINQELLFKLDVARKIAGIPFIINSGYRCKKHNEKIGGKKTSSHLDGDAADIKCEMSWERALILPALFCAGFNRVGIYKNFIHVDISKGKAAGVVWVK